MSDLPRVVWVALLTAFVLTLATPFLLAFLMLLLPGRKGHMRTERNVVHDNMSVADARALYEARLRHERFEIRQTSDTQWLTAERYGTPVGEVRSHADKPMLIQMTFVQRGTQVQLHVAGWMKNFIFFDSGERRHVEATLQRLLTADLESETAPTVPEISFAAMSAVAMVPVSVTGMAYLLMQGGTVGQTTAGEFAGATLCCLAAIFVARDARRNILRRPAELRGMPIVFIAYTAASIGILFGATMLYTHYRAPLFEGLRQIASPEVDRNSSGGK